MDKTLELKLSEFKKALARLKIALDKKLDDEDLIRDAVIQRFEYTFEICFKSVKVFLNENFGIEEKAPKACFRSLISTKFFQPEEIEILIKIVDDRNSTVHTYDQDFVSVLYKKMKTYLDAMQNVYEKISLEK